MKVWHFVLFSLLIGLLAVQPASAQTTNNEAALQNTVWRLERILYSDNKEVRPKAGDKYTLQFLDGQRVAGQADANRILGKYTLSGTILTIETVASTRAAIRPGSIEREYTKALEQASAFRIDGDRLLIMLKLDSGTMTFVRDDAPATAQPVTDTMAIAPLVGTWSLTKLDGRPMPADKKVPTLTFDETGALTGSSGVNRFRTTADMTQLAEGKLSLRPIAGTRMAGPSQAMKEETQFLKALEKARVWKVSGRTLYLEDDRKALLVLRRRS